MQELLEVMGIPYTGSGVSACIRAADKVLAKHAMRDRGIPTPDFYAFNETAFRELGAAQALPAIEERLQFPIVVKPAGQGSALGIKFARTPADVPAALVAAFSYDRKVLLERYVAGPRPGGVDHRATTAARRGRCRSSRRCPSRRTSTTSSPATRSGGRGSCARPRCAEAVSRAGGADRARGVRAARLLGLRARRSDARDRDRGAVRARGQRDPGADRDEPAAPGGGRGRDRVRRADRADRGGSRAADDELCGHARDGLAALRLRTRTSRARRPRPIRLQATRPRSLRA